MSDLSLDMSLLGLGNTSMTGYVPSMMAMSYNPAMMGYNPMMMGGMNYMDQMLEYYKKQNQTQHQIAMSNMDYETLMHELQNQNKIQSAESDIRTKATIGFKGSSVDVGVDNLIAKIKEGDANGICNEFDKLRNDIYTKHAAELKGLENPEAAALDMIKEAYAEAIKQREGRVADLETDIRVFGESAFTHGFWRNFHGETYHDKSTEQALSYIFGTPIDNPGGKARMAKAGAATESVVEGAASAAVGAGAAIGGTALTLGLLKTIPGLGKLVPLGSFLKHGKGLVGWAGALAALAGDIWWQSNRT